MTTFPVKSHLGALVVWTHRPTIAPKARAIVVHGMGEHSARHLNTVENLIAAGYEVVRFDLRGSGESGGERQYIDSFEDYVSDLGSVYRWICEKSEPLPLFLIGHSLGGTIALSFAARYSQELAGLLLSSPAFKVGDAVSGLKIAVGKVLARWIPSMRLPKSTDSKAISRDAQVVEAYDKDPLSCRFNTLNQGSEILKTLDHLLDSVREVRCPTIIFHGTSDRIIRAEGSFELLVNLVKAQEKTLYLLPNGFHEPHNDIDKAFYFELMTGWIRKRVD